MARHSKTKTLRFAVLECLQLSPDISEERGQFAQIFSSWLSASAKCSQKSQGHGLFAHVNIEFTGFDVCEGQYPLDLSAFDAIIVTGSTASAYDDDPWVKRLQGWLQEVYETSSVKIFGGCFGHQIISQALLGPSSGARVEKSPLGWEIGVHDIDLNPDFAKHFSQVLCNRHRKHLACQFLHADHVVLRALEGHQHGKWINIGSTSLCEVQGIFQPGRVLTFQGHPEFDPFLNERGVRNLGHAGILPQEQVKRLMLPIHQQDDALVFGQIVLAFVLSNP